MHPGNRPWEDTVKEGPLARRGERPPEKPNLRTPDLALPASRSVRKQGFIFQATQCVIFCHGNPRKLIQLPNHIWMSYKQQKSFIVHATYIKPCLLFMWNSSTAGHPIFPFAQSGSCGTWRRGRRQREQEPGVLAEKKNCTWNWVRREVGGGAVRVEWPEQIQNILILIHYAGILSVADQI